MAATDATGKEYQDPLRPAVAFVLTAVLGRWGWMWIPIAFFVGISRVYVGVHYPSQVLLGWLCGAFAGFLVVTMHRKWVELRKRNERDSMDEVAIRTGAE